MKVIASIVLIEILALCHFVPAVYLSWFFGGLVILFVVLAFIDMVLVYGFGITRPTTHDLNQKVLGKRRYM